MTKVTLSPLTPSLADTARPELSIEIMPRGEARWSGTAAQLIEEGVAPEGFTWEQAAGGGLDWADDRFTYWALLHRPDSMSGAEWKASSKDFGTVHVRLPETRGTGFRAAREYALKQEIARLKFTQSPAWDIQYKQSVVAQDDRRFQAFLILAGAKRAKVQRGRRPAAARGGVPQ